MINRTVRYCSLTGKCVTPAVNSIFSYHKICLDFTFSVKLEFNTDGTPLTHTVNIEYIDVLCHHIHIHSSLLSDLNTFSANLNSVLCIYPTQGGWTAVMWAAYKGRTDVAQLLLEKGANPNITGQVLRLDKLCSIMGSFCCLISA